MRDSDKAVTFDLRAADGSEVALEAHCVLPDTYEAQGLEPGVYTLKVTVKGTPEAVIFRTLDSVTPPDEIGSVKTFERTLKVEWHHAYAVEVTYSGNPRTIDASLFLGAAGTEESL